MTRYVAMQAMVGEYADLFSAGQGNTIALLVLVLLVGVVLGLGVACFIIVSHSRHWRRHTLRRSRSSLHRLQNFVRRRSPAPEPPAACHWVAVQGSQMSVVQAALRLHHPTPCSWEAGMSVAGERGLFISPPVSGWTLVMGSALPHPAVDVDACFHFLVQLSRRLGHVQYFCFNRALGHHAWVRVEQGRIKRAYAWMGRTVWNQGELTPAEVELGLKCYDYGQAPERMRLPGSPDPAALNTERVAKLATRWSVDPTSLNARALREAQGIVGLLSASPDR